MKKRQILRIFAATPAGFVFFKLQNLRERLFQARTMELRAETDSLVTLSACPDLAVGGKPVDVMIYET